jgi:hypothetical protein
MGQALFKSEIAEISHGVKRRMGAQAASGEQDRGDASIARVVGGALNAPA